MPNLTTAENELLARLTSRNVLALGQKAMQEAGTLIYRLMNIADEATKEHETTKIQLREARFEAACVVVAVSGMVSRADIEQKPTLSDELRARCLEYRSIYDDAMAYRALSATTDPAVPYAPAE